jgi:hypothetical protein
VDECKPLAAGAAAGAATAAADTATAPAPVAGAAAVPMSIDYPIEAGPGRYCRPRHVI